MNTVTEMLIQAYAEDAGIEAAFVREALAHDPSGGGLYKGFDDFRRGFNRALAINQFPGISSKTLSDAADMIENLRNGDEAYHTSRAVEKMLIDLRTPRAESP